MEYDGDDTLIIILTYVPSQKEYNNIRKTKDPRIMISKANKNYSWWCATLGLDSVKTSISPPLHEPSRRVRIWSEDKKESFERKISLAWLDTLGSEYKLILQLDQDIIPTKDA